MKTRRKKMSLLSSRKAKKEDPGNYEPIRFILISEWVMEQLNLEFISRYMKNKQVMRSSQPGFTRGKLCLTNLITEAQNHTII